jgi:hypothetical protein
MHSGFRLMERGMAIGCASFFVGLGDGLCVRGRSN